MSAVVLVGRRRLDPDHQVRLPALRCEERIDLAGLANQRDVGFHTRCNRFQERHIRRACQMPVFGISDNEIEDRFVLRQDDDGGMAHLRLDIDQLIDTGDRLDAQHRSLGIQSPVLTGAIAHGTEATEVITPVQRWTAQDSLERQCIEWFSLST